MISWTLVVDYDRSNEPIDATIVYGDWVLDDLVDVPGYGATLNIFGDVAGLPATGRYLWKTGGYRSWAVFYDDGRVKLGDNERQLAQDFPFLKKYLP